MHPRHLVWIALLPLPAAAEEVVHLRGSTWAALQPPDAPVEDPEVAPWMAARALHLRPEAEGLAVEGSWTVGAVKPGWLLVPLAPASLRPASVTVNGQPAAVAVEGDALWLAAEVRGGERIALKGWMPGDPTRGAVTLSFAPAVRGEVTVDAGGARAVFEGAGAPLQVGERWVGAAPYFALRLTDSAPRVDRGTLAVAQTGVGLTVGDADLRGRANVRWVVRQGSLDRVSVELRGVGADLTVNGPNVEGWTRSGDRVDVRLRAPATAAVDLALAWTLPLRGGTEERLDLPSVRPQGAFRVESTLQLARDGEVDVVPAFSGWTGVAGASLPGWGAGLVEGTPTAAFQRPGPVEGGRVDLYRLELVSAPPVMVDVAAYTVTAADHGRTLTRALYEVRNERASHLRFVPPAGSEVIGVRVAGETAMPTRDAEGGWRVPLARSVETVEGLLSFPVEVLLLGEIEAWERRDLRELPLPAVDAPVAVARTTVYLPPGWSSRLDEGEGGQVPQFTEGEGITYGFGVGDVGAAKADAVFQEAVGAWMSNDFDKAQELLQELDELGASNENIGKLKANLAVIEGKDSGSVAMDRRIKEQARARGVEEERAQLEFKQKADEAALAGDYEAAEQLYGSSLALGEKLAKLEQTEAQDLRSRNAEVRKALDDLKAEANRSLSGPSSGSSAGFGGLGARGSGSGGGGSAGYGSGSGLGLGSGAKVTVDAQAIEISGSFMDELDLEEVDGLLGGTDGYVEGGVVVGVIGGALGGAVASSPGAVATGSGEVLNAMPGLAVQGGYDFGGEAIDGELIAPNGEVLSGRSYQNVIIEEPPRAVPPAPEPSPASRDTESESMLYRSRGISISMPKKATPPPAPPPPPPAQKPKVAPSADATTSLSRRMSMTTGSSARGEDDDSDGRFDTKGANADPWDDANFDQPEENKPMEALPEPEVTTSNLSITLPDQGEAVRFQHLLLPAGAAHAVTLRSKETVKP